MHKNTKRQGELAQCIKSVVEREKNTSEDECETGGETVATDDDDIGSEVLLVCYFGLTLYMGYQVYIVKL